MGGLNAISINSRKGTEKSPIGGLNAISINSGKGVVSKPLGGLNGISIATKGIIIQQISIEDLIGNISDYQVTDARLYDITTEYPDVPLTFAQGSNVANESDFRNSFSPEKIRLAFTVTGTINTMPISQDYDLIPQIAYIDV